MAALGVRLILERRSVSRRVRRIPLRIAVTGTRGKSTVTRLIAGSLRAEGFSVLAKTTGSKPMIILPDGSEEEIVRRGLPTILEQKRIVRRAAELGVRALVVELMSIRPEVLSAESRRLLRPHFVVITNVRVDHREELGGTKDEAARGLASAIPPGSEVFLLEGESHPAFEREAGRVGAVLSRVSCDASPDEANSPQAVTGPSGFSGDLALSLAVSERLGIDRETALRGFREARPDFGSLGVWQAALGSPAASWILASAFAANDPESTARVLERLRRLPAAVGRDLVGLLNLREDRGDRTRQWLEALDEGFFAGFTSLYVVGAHVGVRGWRRRRAGGPAVRPLHGRGVEPLMDAIVRGHPSGALLVGLGNMGGLGEHFVLYWEKIGRAHAV